jgi:hypothetical protein
MSSSATCGTKEVIISVSLVFAPSSLIGSFKNFFFQNNEQCLSSLLFIQQYAPLE